MNITKILSLSTIAASSVFVVGCSTQTANNTNAVNTNVAVDENENTNAVVVNENTNSEQGSEVDTSDWLTYTNDEYGFSFKYPADWEVQEISETKLGVVSPELKETLASGPTSIEVADLFLVINTPATEAPYVTNGFVDSLQEIEKSGEIKELVFSSNNNKANFIDHNDFADIDQNNQYTSINDGIITSAYSVISAKKGIFETILASLSTI